MKLLFLCMLFILWSCKQDNKFAMSPHLKEVIKKKKNIRPTIKKENFDPKSIQLNIKTARITIDDNYSMLLKSKKDNIKQNVDEFFNLRSQNLNRFRRHQIKQALLENYLYPTDYLTEFASDNLFELSNSLSNESQQSIKLEINFDLFLSEQFSEISKLVLELSIDDNIFTKVIDKNEYFEDLISLNENKKFINYSIVFNLDSNELIYQKMRFNKNWTFKIKDIEYKKNNHYYNLNDKINEFKDKNSIILLVSPNKSKFINWSNSEKNKDFSMIHDRVSFMEIDGKLYENDVASSPNFYKNFEKIQDLDESQFYLLAYLPKDEINENYRSHVNQLDLNQLSIEVEEAEDLIIELSLEKEIRQFEQKTYHTEAYINGKYEGDFHYIYKSLVGTKKISSSWDLNYLNITYNSQDIKDHIFWKLNKNKKSLQLTIDQSNFIQPKGSLVISYNPPSPGKVEEYGLIQITKRPKVKGDLVLGNKADLSTETINIDPIYVLSGRLLN